MEDNLFEVFHKNTLVEALSSHFYKIYCICNIQYHAKWAKNHGNFAEAGKLLIYACGRIIQNSMSALSEVNHKLCVFHVFCLFLLCVFFGRGAGGWGVLQAPRSTLKDYGFLKCISL